MNTLSWIEEEYSGEKHAYQEEREKYHKSRIAESKKRLESLKHKIVDQYHLLPNPIVKTPDGRPAIAMGQVANTPQYWPETRTNRSWPNRPDQLQWFQASQNHQSRSRRPKRVIGMIAGAVSGVASLVSSGLKVYSAVKNYKANQARNKALNDMYKKSVVEHNSIERFKSVSYQLHNNYHPSG